MLSNASSSAHTRARAYAAGDDGFFVAFLHRTQQAQRGSEPQAVTKAQCLRRLFELRLLARRARVRAVATLRALLAALLRLARSPIVCAVVECSRHDARRYRHGNRALRVSRGIKAGQVYINAFGAGGGIELPFGGMKKSGHGREKGFAALHDCSQIRTTITKHG